MDNVDIDFISFLIQPFLNNRKEHLLSAYKRYIESAIQNGYSKEEVLTNAMDKLSCLELALTRMIKFECDVDHPFKKTYEENLVVMDPILYTSIAPIDLDSNKDYCIINVDYNEDVLTSNLNKTFFYTHLDYIPKREKIQPTEDDFWIDARLHSKELNGVIKLKDIRSIKKLMCQIQSEYINDTNTLSYTEISLVCYYNKIKVNKVTAADILKDYLNNKATVLYNKNSELKEKLQQLETGTLENRKAKALKKQIEKITNLNLVKEQYLPKIKKDLKVLDRLIN